MHLDGCDKKWSIIPFDIYSLRPEWVNAQTDVSKCYIHPFEHQLISDGESNILLGDSCFTEQKKN